MTPSKLAFFALLVSLSGAACGSSDRDSSQWPISRTELEQNAPTSDPAEGTYRRYCVACHGVDGRGNGGLTGADFTAPDSPLLSKPDSELIASVRNGKRGARAVMPAHEPVLRDDQITAVVAYVKRRFVKTPAAQAPAPAPEAPAPSTP